MRIAVISDIHANLPALEDVLSGIDGQKPDVLYCLGDLVNQNVWNDEVVDLIRRRQVPTVRGNHDDGIGRGQRKFPFSFTFPEARKWGLEAIQYTLAHITEENQAYLASLPLRLRIDVPQNDDRAFSILMTHGGPSGMDDYLFRMRPDGFFAGMLDLAGVDLLLTGNTHAPYHKVLPKQEGGRTVYRHAINPGSVGRPKDGDWRASYAIITLDTTRNLLTDAGSVQADFYRVPYDLGKVVKAIKRSGLAVYYGSCLITG